MLIIELSFVEIRREVMIGVVENLRIIHSFYADWVKTVRCFDLLIEEVDALVIAICLIKLLIFFEIWDRIFTSHYGCATTLLRFMGDKITIHLLISL